MASKYFSRKIVSALIQFLRNKIVKSITDTEVREGLDGLLQPFESTALAVTDADPGNEIIMRDIWERYKPKKPEPEKLSLSEAHAVVIESCKEAIVREEVLQSLVLTIEDARRIIREQVEDEDARHVILTMLE